MWVISRFGEVVVIAHRDWPIADYGARTPRRCPLCRQRCRRRNVRRRHSGAIITASVILMNSSFLSIVSRAPRTLSATSAEPRASTQLESSKMAAPRASWFSLILNSREGSRSEFGKAIPLCGWEKRSSQKRIGVRSAERRECRDFLVESL